MAITDNILFGTTLASTNDQVVFKWPGGRGAFTATGTWGGGSVTLEMSASGFAWIGITDITGDAVAPTANAMFNVELPPCDVRVTVVTSTGITARLDRTYGGSM